MSTNIIRSTTYSYSYLSQPVTASIVKDTNNEQLYLIIYEAEFKISNINYIYSSGKSKEPQRNLEKCTIKSPLTFFIPLIS